jgi:hypothetical protein
VTRLARVLLAGALAGLALAGCGAETQDPLPETVPADAPRRHHEFRRAGLEIDLPRDAFFQPRRAPGLFRCSVGQSFVAAFAYRRREQLPRNQRELQAARRRLVAEVRRRDKRFEVIRSRVTRVAGARAVELVGDQRLGGLAMRTRSVHVYKGRAEYVLDMLAPVRLYRVQNANFFTPAVRSLKVTGRVRGRRR